MIPALLTIAALSAMPLPRVPVPLPVPPPKVCPQGQVPVGPVCVDEMLKMARARKKVLPPKPTHFCTKRYELIDKRCHLTVLT